MAYKFTHKIEFVFEYSFKGVPHSDSIDYCTIRINEENYEALEEFAKDSELELQINPAESYYTNFVKIIQQKHDFDYPNEEFVPLNTGLTDEDYNKFIRIFHIVYPPVLINKPPDFEMVKKKIEERNVSELKNLNFSKDVVITRIVYKRTNYKE
jgi:uncharacterized protein involved in tolerance to divalent cations